jgi:hypothetical protein
MSIVVTQPNMYSFSKNPIIYKLENKENGAIKRSEAAKSVMEVTNVSQGPLNTVFQNNQQVTITISNATSGYSVAQVFTFKDAPNPTIREEISTQATMSEIANQMATHPFIASYVSITVIDEIDHYNFIAEAKELNADLEVEWTASPAAFTITNTDFQSEPDTEGVYFVNFEKNFGQSDWENVYEGTFTVLGDEGVQFLNIQNIIDTEGVRSLKLNPFSYYSKTEARIAENIKRYLTKVVIKPSNQVVFQDTRRVMLGGLPQRVWQQSNFFANIGAHNSFLTYKPNNLSTPEGGVEYITWFNYTNEMKNARVKVKPFQGTTELNAYLVHTNMFVQPGYCCTYPVSPSVLAIPDTATHYETQIINVNNEILSPVRTYYVDRTGYGIRYLAYLNSFGSPEIVPCFGICAVMVNVSVMEWEEIQIKNTGAAIAVQKRISESITRKFIYRTGIITKALKEVYTELALSPSVYDITTDNYQGLTLTNVKNRDELIHEDGLHVHGWQWEFTELVESENFGTEKLHSFVGDLNDSNASGLNDPFANITQSPGAPPVSGLNDNDLIIFALLDNNGNLAGQKYVRSADYMRHVRGLSPTAGSHLDGLAFKNSEDEIWMQSIDNNGNPDYKKQ